MNNINFWLKFSQYAGCTISTPLRKQIGVILPLLTLIIFFNLDFKETVHFMVN